MKVERINQKNSPTESKKTKAEPSTMYLSRARVQPLIGPPEHGRES